MSMGPDLSDEVSRIGDEVGKIRDRLSDSELSQSREIGEVKASVRIVKHELANLQQVHVGINAKLDKMDARSDKMETEFRSSIKDLSDMVLRELKSAVSTVQDNAKLETQKLSAEMTKLSADFTTANTKNQMKWSHYAGVGIGFGTAVSLIGGGLVALFMKIGGMGH